MSSKPEPFWKGECECLTCKIMRAGGHLNFAKSDPLTGRAEAEDGTVLTPREGDDSQASGNSTK